MTAGEIVQQLKGLGKESYKKVLLNHGIAEPVIGVSVEEMKKIQKRIKTDYQLALDLFDTGIYDAMYLAGLIADDARMTRKDLQKWIKKAGGGSLCSTTVAWVAAGSPHGWKMALEWIDSDVDYVASTGWATMSSWMAVKEDAELDLGKLKELLQRVQKTIHQQPDAVRYAMNGFVIAGGTYVKDLTETALKTAEKMGKVTVDMGKTACKVPGAAEYIAKAEARGKIGKKRKSAKC